MLYTATIHRFTTYIVAECIVLAVRSTIASENHYIVLAIVTYVLGIHLASLYRSNRSSNCLTFSKREDVIKLTTFIIFGLSMKEEHELILIVGIKELLCHQWVDIRLVDTCHDRIIQFQRVNDSTNQLFLTIIYAQCHSGVEVILLLERSCISPCGTIWSIQESVVIHRACLARLRHSSACAHQHHHNHADTYKNLFHILKLISTFIINLQRYYFFVKYASLMRIFIKKTTKHSS